MCKKEKGHRDITTAGKEESRKTRRNLGYRGDKTRALRKKGWLYINASVKSFGEATVQHNLKPPHKDTRFILSLSHRRGGHCILLFFKSSFLHFEFQPPATSALFQLSLVPLLSRYDIFIRHSTVLELGL